MLTKKHFKEIGTILKQIKVICGCLDFISYSSSTCNRYL